MFPTCTTRPPRISPSTLLDRSTVWPVCFSISAPIRSEIWGSSSTALVTVISRRLFSFAHISSNWRRMRKIAGTRCFSASSSRKFRSSGSAPSIALPSPSFFSAAEK